MTDSKLPGLMGEYTDEELNAHVIKHAKYFTVVQITRGGFVGGGSNYDRHQVDTLEDARVKAAELYGADRSRGILIYAVADFAGANGFSRPVENYPKSNWESKSQKASREKAERQAARQKAREARLQLGSKPRAAPQPAPVIADTLQDSTLPEGFYDAGEALFYITED